MANLIENNDLVLFQGDSITDAGRDYNDPNSLGGGYALVVAGWFGAMYPQKNVRFLNRGISGNRVKDLVDRWEADCLDLKPTVLSIYIGINDTCHRYSGSDIISPEDFENDYRDLLTRVRTTLDAKIIMCEPYLLPVADEMHRWREDLDPKLNIIRRLARQFDALLVPLDGIMAQASTRRDCAFWAEDGVHPTAPGIALIAQAWLKAIEAI